MAAKVFVSCGQATSGERETAAKVKNWLEQQGFEVFVALETQSLSDINSGTIGRLRRSDYYLLIDFPREKVWTSWFCWSKSRGSLFTHQELAVAFLLDFPEAIFLKHRDVELRGIAQFQMANAQSFSGFDEVLDLVKSLVQRRQWTPDYSRNLALQEWHWNSRGYFLYNDHTGSQSLRVFHVRIANRRNDLGAFYTTARLVRIRNAEGHELRVSDLNDLKWSGQIGFSRTIRPNDSQQFDAMGISRTDPTSVYLLSAADVHPRQPIIRGAGVHTLTYQVFAHGFDILEFHIRLSIFDDGSEATAEIVEA